MEVVLSAKADQGAVTLCIERVRPVTQLMPAPHKNITAGASDLDLESDNAAEALDQVPRVQRLGQR